jgi:hypothetical protein
VRTAAIRRCACGGHAKPGGECAACKARRLAAQSSLVSETLRGPGRPLDPATRAGFESSLAHDFRAVRVHTDARAASSAATLEAHAYTVGTDVVFGAGRYDPGSTAGRRLLAHELTHVRQQAGATPNGPLQVVDDPAAEAEADSSARAVSRMPLSVQRQPRLPDLLPEARLRPPPPPLLVPPGSIRETYILPAPPDVRLEPSPLIEPRERFPSVLDQRLQGPPPFTPVMFIRVPRCIPDRALTWADFTPGNPSGGFGAVTSVTVREENVQGNVMFRAILNRTASRVRAQVLGLGARATNGCAPDVAQCQQHLAGAGVGASFFRNPGAGCPASPFTRATATNVGECESLIGAACDADALAESARLLQHEQGHFDITCKLVGRANDALAAGRPLATVRTWLNTNLGPQQTQYDNDTNHGCDAGQQAAWGAAIAGGLQAVPAP